MLSEVVEEILQSVERLRPMPTSVTRILKELESEGVGAGTIAEYVGLDQALAALVLQMANSASMGYARTCSSLKEAVVRIGFKRLRSLLLVSPSVNSMKGSLRGYRLGAGDLWNHSLFTAMAAESLASILNFEDPEQAYVAGLLHDLGKLLLDQYVLSDYGKIVEFIQHYRLPLSAVEERLIGIDHARVGALIGERWQFPPELVSAIRYHHNPPAARNGARLAAIVNLANAIVIRQYHARSGLFDDSLHPETPAILNLDAEHVEVVSARALKRMEQMA